jgi:hypothetical protein
MLFEPLLPLYHTAQAVRVCRDLQITSGDEAWPENMFLRRPMSKLWSGGVPDGHFSAFARFFCGFYDLYRHILRYLLCTTTIYIQS